jgi:hypothetical protein
VSADSETIPGWCILELMGHRRLAGWVSEQEVAGKVFVRLDVPDTETDGPPVATQLYSPDAVYAITPCGDDTARRVARASKVAPVARWELEAPRPAPQFTDGFDPAAPVEGRADEHPF